jgi:hypothetical protein
MTLLVVLWIILGALVTFAYIRPGFRKSSELIRSVAVRSERHSTAEPEAQPPQAPEQT